LRAEVRDPLWFLTRQWQFGEVEGDDAGSPIDARIAYETAPLDGYRSGADILPYDGKTPLEARVEGEAVPFDLSHPDRRRSPRRRSRLARLRCR
jgi:hypothetical protein